jgi:hypothetical protein
VASIAVDEPSPLTPNSPVFFIFEADIVVLLPSIRPVNDNLLTLAKAVEAKSLSEEVSQYMKLILLE